jgi:CRP-like cAMP-binding protein
MFSGNVESSLLKPFPQREKLTITKGKILIKGGELSTGIFIISKGVVKYTAYKRRKRFTIIYNGQGSVHGAAALINLVSPFSLETVSTVRVEFIPLHSFKNDHAAMTKVLPFVTRVLNEQIIFFADKLGALFTDDSPSLIAKCLVALADLNGHDSLEGITRKEISEYANCSIEYVFRTLSRFHEKKIISVDRKLIKLVNRKSLISISNGKLTL